MSFRLAVEAFDAKVGNPLRKLVLLKLADQANDEGLCWPSYETVAKACEVDRRSVIRHIKKLEEDSFLRIEKVYDKEAKKNKSNRYHLTIAKGVKKSLVTESHYPSDRESLLGSVTESLPSDRESLLGSVTESLPSDRESPKPIIEPISKPINESINAFEVFWEAYDKKIDRAKCEKKWKSLTADNIKLILENVGDYVAANNDKQYRKNPLTYLNGKCWLDEIVVRQPQQTNYQGNNNANHQSANSQPKQSKAERYKQMLNDQHAAKYGNQQSAERPVN